MEGEPNPILENCITCSTKGGNPPGFFPQNLTSVKWSHATNSIAALDSALRDPTILMLESDILMGYLIGSDITDTIPVMSHGPAIHSKLSFQKYLETVMKFNDKVATNRGRGHGMKGIKLDLKDGDVLAPVLQILVANNATAFQFPIWFHADFLRGPIDAVSEPLNAAKFLPLINKHLPGAMISTSWKTRVGEGGPVVGSYKLAQIDELIALLRHHNVGASTPITYPIRTVLGIQSISQILYLLEKSEKFWKDSTITLWHGRNDPPLQIDQVTFLVDTVGRDRVFADIGIEL